MLTVYLADLVHNSAGQGNYVTPLNVGSIGAHVKSVFPKDVEIRLFKYFDDLFKAINIKAPDVLGLSNYLWNYELNKVAAKHTKVMSPRTVVVAGGPHIAEDDDGVLGYLKTVPDVDIYVRQEGELPFEKIVESLLSSSPAEMFRQPIEGSSFLEEGALISGARVKYKKGDLMFPSPYLTGLMDPFLDKGLIPLFETNRGCPYACSFCAWGVASLNNIRRFPTDKVVEEMQYVSKRNPENQIWYFADANFGILERDVYFSEKIREVADENGNLRKVLIWWAKNSTDRNLRIADNLGDLSVAYVALQSLDLEVLEHIGRKNISVTKLLDLLDYYKENRIQVKTDLLLGLPKETKESHITSLKKAVEFGFDNIKGANILLLPSTTMGESGDRRKYDIETAFRTREGSYGEYAGYPVVEFEEIVTSTSTMTKDDLRSFRIIHWLLWFTYNTGMCKPIFDYLRESGIDTIDLIYLCVEKVTANHKRIMNVFDQFNQDAGTENFNTLDEAKQYYLDNHENFNQLITDGFSKLNFKYTAMFLLDKSLMDEFFSYLWSVCRCAQKNYHTTSVDVSTLEELFTYCSKQLVYIAEDSPNEEEIETFSKEAAKYFMGYSTGETPNTSQGAKNVSVRFSDNRATRGFLMYNLNRYGGKSNYQRAMEKTLEITQYVSFIKDTFVTPVTNENK